MFKSTDISQIKNWLSSAKSIIITSHKSPDGDSIGSSLALFHYLNKLGIKSTICHPDKKAYFLEWLDPENEILTLDQNKALVENHFKNADLIFCLDYNHPSRIGKMTDLLINSTANKVMIDHHQNPDTEFVDILLSDPKNSSTCEMIYEFIESNNDLDKIDDKVGTPMYCGIMTDTGSFRFPSTTSRTHQIISSLISKGVQNFKVHENTFDTNTVSKLKLNGYAIAQKLEIIENNSVAYIYLSQKELTDFGYVKGDTEGLVNTALSISGIKMAVFFKEDEGYVKISFRAKGDTFVNVLAGNHFSGGGHIYAAGGKFDGKLEDAISKFVTIVKDYVK